jgi:hypothetical protein
MQSIYGGRFDRIKESFFNVYLKRNAVRRLKLSGIRRRRIITKYEEDK